MSDEKLNKDVNEATKDLNTESTEKMKKAVTIIEDALHGTPYVLVTMSGVTARSAGHSILDQAFMCKMASEMMEYQAKNGFAQMGFFGPPPQQQGEMTAEIQEALEKAQREVAEEATETAPKETKATLKLVEAKDSE